MAEFLQDRVTEGSAWGVIVTLTDETGARITPKTLKWTLSTPAGAVVNNRLNVDEPAPGETTTIGLLGTDTEIGAGEMVADGVARRVLTLEATYDSATLGNDVPAKKEYWFEVEKLIKQ
ncbi:MAG: hypothetical protein ABFD89_01655 [Bryobacteraceae bacterium]